MKKPIFVTDIWSEWKVELKIIYLQSGQISIDDKFYQITRHKWTRAF